MSGPREPRSNLHSRGPSMRNNKAILDEAARSVRRTFIGSVAGTLTMLAVVGAAGAYGMPENLTAQAQNPFTATKPEPAPTVPASLAPSAPAAIVAAPGIAAPAATVAAPVVQAAPVRNPFAAADAEPAPTVTASLAPSAAPAVAEE